MPVGIHGVDVEPIFGGVGGLQGPVVQWRVEIEGLQVAMTTAGVADLL